MMLYRLSRFLHRRRQVSTATIPPTDRKTFG